MNIDTTVWLSTPDHIRRFREVTATGARGRSASSFVIGQLPHVAPLWGLLGLRFPCPFLAHGRLRVTESAFLFQSTPPRIFGNRVANLREGLRWDIPLDRFVSVESYRASSPVSAKFDLLFAHVRTAETGFAGDFLVGSAEKKYDPEAQRVRSEELLAALQDVVARRGWGRSGSRVAPA